MKATTFKYAYEIDLATDTTGAKVVRLVGKGRKVLELGCGPGHMSRVLKGKMHCEVFGVEMDAEAAAHAMPYCESVTVCNLDECDIEKLFGGKKFDVIVMADVLEHLKNPERTLAQCRGLLGPDGRIVVSIPNVTHKGIISCLLAGQFPYRELGLLDATHLRFFTGYSFRRILADCGFLIEKWDTYEVPVEYTEFKKYYEGLPPGVKDYLSRGPDSDIYQFVLSARLSLKGHGSVKEDPVAKNLDAMVKERVKRRDIWFETNYSCHGAWRGARRQGQGRENKTGILSRLVTFFKRP